MSEKQASYGDSKKITYREAADALFADHSTRFWLKEAIQTLDQKDPIDSLNDAALLLNLQKMRVNEILTKNQKGKSTE